MRDTFLSGALAFKSKLRGEPRAEPLCRGRTEFGPES